jgi:putative DNA primase/helicase
MQTHNDTPGNSSHSDYSKDTKLAGLNPVFNDLNVPDTIINHVEKLVKKTDAPDHTEILTKLLQQFVQLDFEALANPHNVDDFKLNNKHFLVLSIENVLQFAEKNRWGICKNHDFIYLYNGTFWTEIDKETFQKFLGEAAEKMGIAKFSARYYQFREQLFKQFLAAAYLPTPPSNKDKVLINLKNGTFEISPQGTKLRPFDRSDFITYQLPFEYNPQAKAPIFQTYLNRVLPDKERQKVLAEYLGYVFIKHGGRLKLEAALILYGPGANGKSVFYEVTNALLGAENVSSYSLQELTDDLGYYRAMIANKLVNYASEINGKLGADKFKKMVSGEVIPARLPYGKPMLLTNYAKFIFNCNELPKDVEHTNAYFRRWLIIPFDVTIPKAEQDSELHSKIIEKELSGVFNWVLEGLNRLLEQKRFSECEAAQKAVEKYRIESDSVQIFLNDHGYMISPTKEIPLKDMFSEYQYYCTESGFKACSIKTLAERLRNTGYQTERKNYGMGVNAEKKSFF